MRQTLDTLDVGVYERAVCMVWTSYREPEEQGAGSAHDFWEVQPPLGLKDGDRALPSTSYGLEVPAVSPRTRWKLSGDEHPPSLSPDCRLNLF